MVYDDPKHGAFNYRNDCGKKCKLNLEDIVFAASADGLKAERLAAIGSDGRSSRGCWAS